MMTTLNNELNNLLKQLQAAQTDAALFERLQAAPALAAKLAAEYDQLAGDTAKQETEKLEAEREARFAKIGNLAVTERGGEGAENGLLGRQFDITWTAPKYDYQSGQNVPQQIRCDHFLNLYKYHPDVFDYLTTRKGDLVPTAIRDLVPDRAPYAALIEYFTSLQRGYTRGPVAA
ncbi:hypothetical protein K3177_09990 [Qipengyuania sp. GH25]|uniref:Uncharacterized protein n=1 Tax=Qipengyuania pacifica TaxID=2860199 RepID=A0ABS7JGS7_9SPHN|nr:hypothetical protein [Qipengyuania aerophila]MBX7488843.1 hypothetical protein [Qipengyuania aerophila]